MYWNRLQTFTEFIFNGISSMWNFLTSNSLTFTALAIGVIIFAMDILFSVGKDEED